MANKKSLERVQVNGLESTNLPLPLKATPTGWWCLIATFAKPKFFIWLEQTVQQGDEKTKPLIQNHDRFPNSSVTSKPQKLKFKPGSHATTSFDAIRWVMMQTHIWHLAM